MGGIGAVVLLLIFGIVIIFYIRQKSRHRNSTSSTSQPVSVQNATYLTNQTAGSLENLNYSTNEQNTMTDTLPPSPVSLYNLPPFYSPATRGFARGNVLPNTVPATNPKQNDELTSTIFSADNPNSNSNPEEIVRDVPATIEPVENVGER